MKLDSKDITFIVLFAILVNVSNDKNQLFLRDVGKFRNLLNGTTINILYLVTL